MSKKLAIVYYSKTGNTQEIAEAIQSGAQINNVQCNLIFADELKPKQINKYDFIAFGSPADGDEEIHKTVRNIFDLSKPLLKDKPIVLFGSFGWGNGEFMAKWIKETYESGLNFKGSFICKKFPEEKDIEQAKNLGFDLTK